MYRDGGRFFAPTGVPTPIVEKLHDDINAILSTEESKSFFNRLANDLLVMSLDQAKKLYLDEVKAWGVTCGTPTSNRKVSAHGRFRSRCVRTSLLRLI